MPAAGQPFTKVDYVMFAASLVALALVAVTLAAMTGHTGRPSCAAATNPSTSAPVGPNCVPAGFAAR
jgi:hypothetical protein